MTTLSIIIPVYNKEQYLSQCLNSILNQNYSDYEIIIINDGSNDSSDMIAEDYSRQYDFIHNYNFDNAGVSIARNRGIERATGKYIIFVDADDWIESDYLKTIMSAATENDADVLIWGITKDFPNKKSIKKIPEHEGIFDKRIFIHYFIKEHYDTQIGLYGYSPNKLIKRIILDKYSIRFNPVYHLQEDYDFYIQYYQHCNLFKCIQYAGYHYLADTANSSTVTNKNIDYLSLIDIQHKCQLWIKDIENNDSFGKIKLDNIISNLVIAGYLEKNTQSLADIKNYTNSIYKKEFIIDSIKNSKTKHKLLKYLILRKRIYAIYLYVILWRKYIYFRTK